MHCILRALGFSGNRGCTGISLEHLVSSSEQVANKLFLKQWESRLPLLSYPLSLLSGSANFSCVAGWERGRKLSTRRGDGNCPGRNPVSVLCSVHFKMEMLHSLKCPLSKQYRETRWCLGGWEGGEEAGRERKQDEGTVFKGDCNMFNQGKKIPADISVKNEGLHHFGTKDC